MKVNFIGSGRAPGCCTFSHRFYPINEWKTARCLSNIFEWLWGGGTGRDSHETRLSIVLHANIFTVFGSV